MDMQNSKTQAALKAAFDAECKNYCRYMIFSQKAKDEGYEQIAAIFEDTAKNEKEHAEIWMKMLGNLCANPQNLQASADGEHYEWSDMYSDYEQDARDEGFNDIADKFRMIGEIEKQHEERFRKLLENVQTNHVFEKDGEAHWECRKCGYTVIDKKAPDTCPVCSHPKSEFEIKKNNY